MRKMKFKIGDKVRDIISGYEGKVTARTEWLNGCVRYRVEPDHLNPDGELIENETFDEEQLEKVKTPSLKLKVEPTGGSRSNDSKPNISK